MKNNKTTQYILLGLVITIWGIIAYRLANYFSSDNDYAVYSSTVKPFPDTPNPTSDTFSLQLNYPDPFALTRQPAVITTTNTPTLKKKKEKLPGLSYRGFAKSANGQILVRVVLNGQPTSLKLRQDYDGLVITRANRDSLSAKWNGKLHHIHRK